MEKEDININETIKDNTPGVKMIVDNEDLYKLYGKLLADSAEDTKKYYTEIRLLENKLSTVKKILLTIIYGLIAIIIASVVGLTVVFSSMTIEINNSTDSGAYGDIEMYDNSNIDNSSENVDGEQVNNNYYTED